VLYRAAELTVSPVLRAVFRPQVTGADRVPRTGPVIIVANHLSACDEVFTPVAARRQVFYFAKAEYFRGTTLRGQLTAAVFTRLGQVPVERSDVRAAASVIDVGIGLLEAGRAVGIYPEGTRSRDGLLHRFRTGAARLAVRSGAPVVPVGLVGTDLVLPATGKLWHRMPLEVHFGPVLNFAGRAEDERSSRSLREVTETIREAVQSLSGQAYSGHYAGS
jgi:1-acyl-sn-glycerol-3-phosphate acyltransferase